MQVILLKDFEKLGKEGDSLKVKDGYANNYLIPAGLALRATEDNFKKFEDAKKRRAKVVGKAKEEFQKLKTKIDKISLTIPVEAKENEELYGSISQAQILKQLKAEGLGLDKDKLVLDAPIEKLGVFNLKVNLFPEVEANLRVWVVRK
jgi:large subunit ribosomal protein L9